MHPTPSDPSEPAAFQATWTIMPAKRKYRVVQEVGRWRLVRSRLKVDASATIQMTTFPSLEETLSACARFLLDDFEGDFQSAFAAVDHAASTYLSGRPGIRARSATAGAILEVKGNALYRMGEAYACAYLDINAVAATRGLALGSLELSLNFTQALAVVERGDAGKIYRLTDLIS